MSDMLSAAVSDSETCDDYSEAESRGRNKLGRDWPESAQCVLFGEVLEVCEVSWSFATSPTLLSPISEYASSRTH